jgi:hypothetical protein
MTDASAAGLCATCRWMRRVSNRRGSVFYRCARADTDPRFPRYPPLPVVTCAGYERSDSLDQTERDRDEG